MKKKLASIFGIVLIAVLSAGMLAGCSGSEMTADEDTETTAEVSTETTAEAGTDEEEDAAGSGTQTEATMSAEELDELLAEQELFVTDAMLVVDERAYNDDDEKVYFDMYPDELHASVQNNSTYVAHNIVVAFAAWDADGQPIQIESGEAGGTWDVDDTNSSAYVKEAAFEDVDIASGAVSEDGVITYALAEDYGIATVKAIVVSYENSLGDYTWENPYYSEFLALYDGKTLS